MASLCLLSQSYDSRQVGKRTQVLVTVRFFVVFKEV